MSKASNVHPGHYKVAGRGRQGEGLLQEEQKRAYVDQRESVRRFNSEEQAGIPNWEATPPNLETTADPAPTPVKSAKKARTPAKKSLTKRNGTRRAAPRRATRPRSLARRKGVERTRSRA